ncbi:MAG: DHA2 family efflux MFS transporter permease subunit [Azoarcus sp.]|jgi:DHA2 family multidrug resistance protein|nr:DHA2 family efflux MFS transporter permease subunit [Azoarcus sp.]
MRASAPPSASQPPLIPPLEGGARLMATIVLALATLMIVLDMTIANVSIPTIAGDLGVSASQGAWVITSFAVANAIAVPLTGWLARRFGQVRVFLWSTVLFVAVSLLCGLARSLEMLVAARVFQGLVAGPIISLSQSLLLQCYPKALAGIALAVWGLTATVAPVIGPILGGWISDNAHWGWIFYINIPIGLATAGMSWLLLKKRELPTVRLPIDVTGLALLVLWVGAMQLALDKGKELDWFGSPLIVALAVVAVVGFCFFLAWELTEKHPIIDLALFTRRSFTLGTLSISLAYGVFFANVVILPLWLQQYLGYTATWAGLVTAPVGILTLLFTPLVGKAMGKIDPRFIVTGAFVVFALTSFMRAGFNAQVDTLHVIWPQFVQGIALAGFFVPLTAIILSGLDPARTAAASGLSNFARITAGAFGSSLSITLWEDRAALHHAQLSEAIHAYSPATQRTLDALAEQGIAGDQALVAVNRIIDTQAAVLSATEFFWASGVLFLLLIVCVAFAKPTRRG